MQVFKTVLKRDDFIWSLYLWVMIYTHFLRDMPFSLWLLAIIGGLIYLSWGVITAQLQVLIVGADAIRQQQLYKTFYFLGSSKLVEIPYRDIRRIEVNGSSASQADALTITRSSGDVFYISRSQYTDLDQIMTALQQHVAFDSHPVVNVQGFKWPDVGGRWVVLVESAVVILLADTLIRTFLHMQHLRIEAFMYWFAIIAPVCVLATYLYIRGEKKAYPALASLICGLLMTFALNLILLTANRLYTEWQAVPQVQTFLLLKQDDYKQRWLAQDGVMKGEMVEIRVKGDFFNPELKPGHRYQIVLQQGLLNDWAIAPDAFKHARAVDSVAADTGDKP